MSSARSTKVQGVVQSAYWLALGVWIGALVMLAVAAAIVFRTSRAMEPVLLQPQFSTPDLVGQSATILAGAIVGNVIQALLKLQLVCAVLLIVAMVYQHVSLRPLLALHLRLNALRVGLILLATLVLVVNMAYITPAMWTQRERMYDNTQSAEYRLAAREQFNALHKFTERVTGGTALGLVIAGIASGLIFSSGRSGSDDGEEV